jgi:hypothetical protein
MPNLVVTNACNLGCPFCFATEYRADPSTGAPAAVMSVEEFGTLVQDQPDRVRFCGGEPTLHPRFLDLLAVSLAVPGRRVLVMTNGLWPSPVRQAIRGLHPRDRSRLSFLFNVLEPHLYGPGQETLLHDTLRVVHPRAVTLGLTFHAPPFRFAFLLELARRYHVPSLRFSVAAPNTTDPATWLLDPERDFPALAVSVHALVTQARALRLHVHSDCGYVPPCMFTARQLSDISTPHPTSPASFHCHGPVDVGPGGQAWRCYGLYALVQAHVADADGPGALAADLEAQAARLSHRLLMDRCAECPLHADGTCGGGCLAFRVARSLRLKAAAAGIPVADEAGLLAWVPVVDGQSLRRLGSGPHAVLMTRGEEGWEPLSASAVESRLVALADGQRTLQDVAALLPDLPRSAVTRAARRLLEHGGFTLELAPRTTPPKLSP